MKISDLRPQQKNANKHTPYGLRLMEQSISRDGIIDAQTAAADGEIISGSARLELEADKFADVEPIIVHSDGTRPVIVVRDDIPNADSARARRLSVAANQIARADYDPDWALLKEWNGEDDQIQRMFNDDEWAEGTGEEKQQADAEPQIDRAAELLEKWQVKTGDLWQIGEHRLLCGDSTKREDVERVMGGERVEAVLTDPPYNMGKDIENDSLDDDSFITLHREFIGNLPLSDKATFICFHSPRTFPAALDEARRTGLKFERMLYMTKPNDITFPWRGWLLKSEAILVFSIGGGSWIDVHPYTADTYLFNHSGGEIRDGGGKAEHSPLYHPSIKPMIVVSDLLSRIGGNIVYDPFAGSGTTLVACQNLGRKCRAIEIAPRYCAVILERMSTAFPGIEIKRLE